MEPTAVHRSITRSFRSLIAPALVAVATLSTGCVTATRVPLQPADRDRIRSARVVGALSQQEIKVAVIASRGGAGFGLIGAIVDSAITNSRAKDAEAMVAPVRDGLVGYGVEAALTEALTRELQALPWLAGGKVEVRQVEPTPAAISGVIATSGADVVLLVQTDYRLSPGFEAIVTTAAVTIYPAKAAARPPADAKDAPELPAPLYQNTFVASALLPGFTPGTTQPADAAKMWADREGSLARRALGGGVAEVARMIAFDLVQGAPAGQGSAADYQAPEGARDMTAFGAYAGGLAQGYVVREEKGRSWLRVRTGELLAGGAFYP